MCCAPFLSRLVSFETGGGHGPQGFRSFAGYSRTGCAARDSTKFGIELSGEDSVQYV
jgi:hypothetical protein